jgi:hypothetical protein
MGIGVTVDASRSLIPVSVLNIMAVFYSIMILAIAKRNLYIVSSNEMKVSLGDVKLPEYKAISD